MDNYLSQKKDLLLHANYYYNSMDFNVTCISEIKNKYNQFDKNLNKTPCHPWIYLIKNRQELNTFKSYDWHLATGLGAVLGYKSLRALDIDGCKDINFIKKILKNLNLPSNYEWVVKSGSGNGFHIIFYCDEHNFSYQDNPIVTFLSNFENNSIFQKIELRWVGHLVLPPTGSYSYNFVNTDIPIDKPKKVSIDAIDLIIESNCLKTFNKSYNSGGGYCYKVEDIELVDSTFSKEPLIDPERISEFLTKGNNFNGYVVIDTETNGLPIDDNISFKDGNNWPRMIQLAYAIFHENGQLILKRNFHITPQDFEVKSEILKLTNISLGQLINYGVPLRLVLNQFIYDTSNITVIVGHNITYDIKILLSECYRLNIPTPLENGKLYCTMKICQSISLINNRLNGKYPKLKELHQILFDENFMNAHDAMSDVLATNKCYLELLRLFKNQKAV